MKSKIRVINFFIFLAILLSSCSIDYQGIYPFYSGNLHYLYESKEYEKKFPIVTNIEVFNNVLPDSNMVKNDYYVPIPLLIVNLTFIEDTVFLSKKNVKPELNTFIKTSMIEEINRRGLFHVSSNDVANNQYNIRIYIDTCEVFCNVFNYIGFYLFIPVQRELSITPSLARIKVNLELFNSSELVLRNSYNSYASVPYMKTNYNPINPYGSSVLFAPEMSPLFKASVINMVESLSYAIKFNNEKILTDLNTYFKKISEEQK